MSIKNKQTKPIEGLLLGLKVLKFIFDNSCSKSQHKTLNINNIIFQKISYYQWTIITNGIAVGQLIQYVIMNQ